MHGQGDLFGDKATQVEASPLAALTLEMPRACPCGSSLMKAGSGRGLYLASLRCSACGRNCGWISQQVADFLLEIIRRFGCPTSTIKVRR
jgi:hypothetical protein